MGLKVRFDLQAKRDLQDIRSYLVTQAGDWAAERVRLELKRRIAMLAERPLAGVATDIAHVRVLLPTRYPYRIYYVLRDDTVVILHIRHTSRRSPDASDLGN